MTKEKLKQMAFDSLFKRIYKEMRTKSCSCGEGTHEEEELSSLDMGVWDIWDRNEVCLVTSLAKRIEELSNAILDFVEGELEC